MPALTALDPVDESMARYRQVRNALPLFQDRPPEQALSTSALAASAPTIENIPAGSSPRALMQPPEVKPPQDGGGGEQGAPAPQQQGPPPGSAADAVIRFNQQLAQAPLTPQAQEDARPNLITNTLAGAADRFLDLVPGSAASAIGTTANYSGTRRSASASTTRPSTCTRIISATSRSTASSA